MNFTYNKYVLYCLALVDMKSVSTSLDYLKRVNDEHLQCILLRDAVVSYAKPFSNNRGTKTKINNLRVSIDHVPEELKSAHEEIIELRNKLFAHMDLDKQKPEISVYEINGGKHFSVRVDGYSKIYPEHLIDPLNCLAEATHKEIIKELFVLQTQYDLWKG